MKQPVKSSVSVGLLLAILFGMPAICGAQAAAQRLNVLFIAVDDLRPELGCYGDKFVHSPNIDRLAASAVTFERAYCQIAVCNPSRVSLLTGMRPDTTRVWDLVTRFRHTMPDAVTLPQYFKQHGYRALSFGKIFHNPWPDNASWSEPHEWPKDARLWSDDAKQRLTDFREKMKAAGKSKAAIRRMRAQATEIVDLPDGEHTDGAIAEQAMAALRQLAKRGEPFFLATGFVRPHLPFVVPRKYWELYERDKIPLAPNDFLPRGAPAFAMNTMYELRDYFDYSTTSDPRDGSLTTTQQRELKHGYLAAVSMVDALIGRLLGELERLHLADNTVVMLWSDHGWKLGEHNSWCKQTNHEIDTRVPLIIRAPGAKANGRMTRSLAELLDLFPTLCELTGLPIPGFAEGISLLPVLQDADASVRDAAFSQFRRREGQRELMGYAMKTDRYRYVEWLDRGNLAVVARELYDHSEDPGENTNIADSAERTVRALGQHLWTNLPRPGRLDSLRPQLIIRNESRQAVQVFWEKSEGDARRLVELPVGEAHTINTTMGHRFSVRGTVTDFKKLVTVNRQEQVFTLKAGRSPLPNTVTDRQEVGVDRRLVDLLTKVADEQKEPLFEPVGFATFSLRGWKVHLNAGLWRKEPKLVTEMLDLLAAQLDRVIKAVPEQVQAALRAVPIWINPPFPGARPGAAYHPDIGWLKENGRDPAMAKAVEITNTKIFAFENTRMPYLMLHELAHAYHDRVLGFDQKDIMAAFAKARDSGGYDSVKRFNGRKIVTDKAYAMSNHKEYFAENTEAYFGRNDFFPFEREELRGHDPEMLKLLEKLWKVNDK